MEQLFEKYTNIQLCMEKYRKYSIMPNTTQYYNFDDFKNKMQVSEIIIHNLFHNETKELLDIYLFKEDSKYIKSTANFKKLLNKYSQDEMHIIFFSKIPLSIYIKKAIIDYPKLHIQ